MAKKTKPAESLNPVQRLSIRVSNMINSPTAQIERRVTIHRLETDPDEAWEVVLELLAETDGLEMTRNSDGTVTLRWDRPVDDDVQVRNAELEPVAEDEAAF